MKPLDLSLRLVAMLGLVPAVWAEDQLPDSSAAQLPPPGVISAVPSPDDINFLPPPVEPAPALPFDLREIEPVLPKLSTGTDSSQLFSAPRVFVKEFRFVGNTVFSSGTLRQVLKTYTGREFTSEELEAARQAITTYYVNHGYITTAAPAPFLSPRGRDAGNPRLQERFGHYRGAVSSNKTCFWLDKAR